MSFIDKLRTVVAAATPGPWDWNDSYVFRNLGNRGPYINRSGNSADNEFGATFDPALVAALLDVVAAAEKGGHTEGCAMRFDSAAECDCTIAALARVAELAEGSAPAVDEQQDPDPLVCRVSPDGKTMCGGEPDETTRTLLPVTCPDCKTEISRVLEMVEGGG